MKIKKLMAGLLVCLLLALNLTSVCFAAEAGGEPPVETAETETVPEAADAETTGVGTVPEAAETDSINTPDNVTMGGTFALPFDSMRRYVKRGSKGIALVDTRGDVVRLRYVFDVSDTGARRNFRPVNLWKMQDEYIPAIKENLCRAFDIGGTEAMPLADVIEEIAGQLAGEYWDDHREQILDIVDDSFLYGYDEDNVRVSFRRAAETSIKYMLLTRCVEDVGSYFEPEDFMDVFDFNTQGAVNVLGTAVSEVSGRVFREIERTIRTYERGRAAERSQKK